MGYDMENVALITEIMSGIDDGMGSLYYVKQDKHDQYRVYLNRIYEMSNAEIARDVVVRNEVFNLWKTILKELRDYDFDRMRAHKQSRVRIVDAFGRLFD